MTAILAKVEDFILPVEREEHAGFFRNLFASTGFILKVVFVMMAIRYAHYGFTGVAI